MATLREGSRDDLPAVRALLRDAGLPTDGIDACLADLVVLDAAGAGGPPAVIGAVALERAGETALLRSLVVRAGERGSGHGGALFDAIVARARAAGLAEVWLLTETPGPFFARRGFVRAPRDAAPEAIRATDEFTTLCSATATLMRLSFGGPPHPAG